MKASKLIALALLMLITLTITISTDAQPLDKLDHETGTKNLLADEDLLLQLYVDKGAYNTGDEIYVSGKVSLNSFPIVSSQVCLSLYNDSGVQLWGACMMTDIDGWFAETLKYIDHIPEGYSGNLVLTATAAYEELDAYSEMFVPYGTGSDDDDDDEQGELTLSLFTYDKVEFVIGDHVTVGMEVAYNGLPLTDGLVCPAATDDGGNILFNECIYTDSNGVASFQLGYLDQIPSGYSGYIYLTAGISYSGLYEEEYLAVPYLGPTADLPIELQLWGPPIPVQIGGWEEIQLGGTVTSQGFAVDGATVTLSVAGNIYQTTTGLVNSGEFYYGWSNDTFPAGEYVVQVTVSVPGYQSASGTIPVTVFGDAYDFAVVMDPLQAVYDPAVNVPFPGTLTLGGAPVADWIDIDVTYPDGTIETFINLSEADGRFTVTIPSLMAPGTYQMVVYYQGDRKQISPVYIFSVGAAKPTDPPNVDNPPEGESDWRIINVTYSKVVTLGETITLTGTLVTGEGENQLPLPDIPIQLGVGGVAINPVETWETVSRENGTFTFQASLTSVLWNELGILALKPNKKAGAVYYDYLEILMPVGLTVSMDRNSYQTGERVSGTVEVLPEFDTSDHWYDSLGALIQIIGPSGSNELTYILGSNPYQKSGYVPYSNFIDFWWVVPEGAEAGSYRVEVIVSSPDIVAAEGSTTFSLEEFHSVNFSADFSAQAPGYDLYQTAYDYYYPGRVFGKYTDHNDFAIDKADVRIIAVNTEKRTQKVELMTTTDKAGEFNLTLEQLNCLGGDQPVMWELTVYADKEGYSTGAAIVYVQTPVAAPRVEIIEADPLTNDLELQSYSGQINYTQEKPYTIRLKVKYTTCQVGSDLWVNTRGDWALKPEKVAKADNGVVMCGESTWNQSVSINGSPADPIGYYDLWDSSPWTNTSWSPDIWLGARHETLIPLDQGIGKEIEVVLAGNLFNFQRLGENPEKKPERCVLSMSEEGSPTVPPDYGLRVNLGKRGINVDMAMITPIEMPLLEEADLDPCYFFDCTGINYLITQDKGLGVLFVKGTAWVGVGDGNIQATVKHGVDARLVNHDVQLQAMVEIENPGPDVTEPYEPTDLIKVPSSVRTDDAGHFSIPLEFEGDSCDHMDKTFVIKVSTEGFEDSSDGNYVLVNLRCTPNIHFSFTEASISVFQAADVSDNEPMVLADRKVTGVRVGIEAAGEIDEKANVGISMRVRIGGKEFTQHKIIEFRGAKQNGAIYARNVDGSGTAKLEVDKLLDSVVMFPVDFVFTPTIQAKEALFDIEITLDEDKIYGETISEVKAGTVQKMKGLSLMVAPYGVSSLDLTWVLKQVNFIKATYPIDADRVRVDYNFAAAQAPYKATLGAIASLLELGCISNANNNEDYRIVGVVHPDHWDGTLDRFWGALDSNGAWLGNSPSVLLLKYENKISEHVLAHELGHSYGLFIDKEQYKITEPVGYSVQGVMIRNGKPYSIPSDLTDSETTNWVAAFGLNPAEEQQQLIQDQKLKWGAGAPLEVFDIMGAADGSVNQRTWILPSTYGHLLSALKDPPDSQVLNVRGMVYEDRSVHLDPVWMMTGLPDNLIQALSTEIGEYDLQIRSGSGEVLSNTKFGVVGLESPFSFDLAMLPGTASVVVSLNGEVLGELTRSASAPVVQFTQAPVLHEDGMLDLYWGSSDPDGDNLTYGIQYRCNEDENWLPIQFSFEEQTYSLDTSQLTGGGNCKARVLVTDGFNTTTDISPPFSIPTKAPNVAIITELTREPYQSPVRLEGTAYDPEWGFLPEDRMTWSSDIDGEIGNGSYIEVHLSPGEHTITLVGEDANGMMSRAIIQVTVEASPEDEPLTGLGSGLGSLWFIGFLVLAALMGLGSVLILWLVLRRRKGTTPVLATRGGAYPAGGQQGMTQDSQGRWWYQDPNTGAWSIWNGTAWQPAAARQSAAARQRVATGPTPVAFTLPTVDQSKPRGGGSCLLTIIIFAILALVVLGGITLVAFNFFPGTEIQPGMGDLSEILKTGGGGLLIAVLGGFLLNGGLKSVITRRAVVEDEWGRKREKRGCGAVLNGLGSLAFGVILIVGGLGLVGLAFFQEVLPYLGI